MCFAERDWQRLAEVCELRMLPAAWDEAKATELMRGAEVVMTGWGTGPLTAMLLAPAPGLRLWMHSAGSMAPLATPAVWERNLLLSTANDVLARGVAEYTLALTIMALKQVVPMNACMHAGEPWTEARRRHAPRELCDLCVGMAGFGRVARHLATLLASFTGLDLVACDPYVSAEVFSRYRVRAAELDDICRTADVIHNCLPWIPETVGTFSARRFQMMKDNAIFINAGRGATVDEQALAAELSKGRLYACLDVTHPEPPAAASALLRLPNCVVTPHVAGAASNGRRLLGRFAADEVLRYCRGEPLLGQVTRQEVERMTGAKGG
jgi:phosphoglycerate dehydrogenase-like enzyme